MAIRQYQCEKCEFILEQQKAMTEPALVAFNKRCPSCRKKARFERIHTQPVAYGFGMIGIGHESALVGGSGFYATDYAKSDLVAKRINEAWMKNDEKAGRPIMDATKNEAQTVESLKQKRKDHNASV